LSRIEKRGDQIEGLDKARRDRETKAAQEKATLKQAFKQRNIVTRETLSPPDMEDAAVSLSDASDPSSSLSFPVILLYPLAAQSDFIKAVAETETLAQHLEYILPTPWDEAHEYTAAGVECYIETASSGLIKAGKAVTIAKLLGSGKVEVIDGLVKVNVVPKAKAAVWIEEFKRRRGKQ
jgi:hypothetical protein